MAERTDADPPIEVFYSYAHADEPLRNRVQQALVMLKRQGLIQEWHDREIMAGTAWKGQIDEHLKPADVILLLVNPDFLASDYCYDVETSRALERHAAGEARVISIILSPCDWKASPLADLQALPHDARPVTNWTERDEAFLNVSQGIRAAIESLRHP